MNDREQYELAEWFRESDSYLFAKESDWKAGGKSFFQALIVVGSFTGSIILLSRENILFGILLLSLGARVLISLFRTEKIENILEESTQELDTHEVEQVLNYGKCKKCEEGTSFFWNVANMLLVEIRSPYEFDINYGMLCSEHSSELTRQILTEKNYGVEILERAKQIAIAIAYKTKKSINKPAIT